MGGHKPRRGRKSAAGKGLREGLGEIKVKILRGGKIWGTGLCRNDSDL